MQIGMIGLGRMGANMVRRLLSQRSQLRGVQPLTETRAGTGQGKGHRRDFACRPRQETRETASNLDDGAGGVVDATIAELLSISKLGTFSSTAATLITSTTCGERKNSLRRKSTM